MANNGGDDTVAAVSAMGFDGYYVALEAIKAAGTTDAQAVNEALWNVQYTGVTGAIAFNETGDADRSSAFVKHADNSTGAWEFVGEQSL